MLSSAALRPSDVATLIYRGKSEASAALLPRGDAALIYRGKPVRDTGSLRRACVDARPLARLRAPEPGDAESNLRRKERVYVSVEEAAQASHACCWPVSQIRIDSAEDQPRQNSTTPRAAASAGTG